MEQPNTPMPMEAATEVNITATGIKVRSLAERGRKEERESAQKPRAESLHIDIGGFFKTVADLGTTGGKDAVVTGFILRASSRTPFRRSPSFTSRR